MPAATGSQLVTLTITEGVAANPTVPLIAQGVTVDNLSASWLQLPDAGRFVPPFTHGFTTAFVGAVTHVRVEWYTPNGIMSPTAGQGNATLTVSTEALPFNPGVVVVQATPTGSATPSQTHVIVDSGSITPVQPVVVTIGGQPISVVPTAVSAALSITDQNIIAAGASHTVIGGVGGKTITVYSAQQDFGQAASVTGADLVDTTSTIWVYRFRLDESVAPRSVSFPFGLRLPTSAGLMLRNDAASAASFTTQMVVTYIQS